MAKSDKAGTGVAARIQDELRRRHAIHIVAAEQDGAILLDGRVAADADQRGNLEVVGGWEPTAMSSDTVDPSAEDDRPGDQALEDAIRRERREDASTHDLALDIAVERGVARIRGTVSDLTDTENAESVASQVPGVREVVDETTVRSL